MRTEARSIIVVVATAVLVTMSVVAIAHWGIPGNGPAPPPWSGSSPTVERALTIAPVGPGPDAAYAYSTASILVPLHTTVVFTITNYDPGSVMLITPSDARVAGTTDGMMMIETPRGTIATDALATDGVSHTFSMSDGLYHLNVPVPPAGGNGPSQVSFTMVFDQPGTYDWGCVVPCGGADMSDPAGMYGTITVA